MKNYKYVHENNCQPILFQRHPHASDTHCLSRWPWEVWRIYKFEQMSPFKWFWERPLKATSANQDDSRTRLYILVCTKQSHAVSEKLYELSLLIRASCHPNSLLPSVLLFPRELVTNCTATTISHTTTHRAASVSHCQYVKIFNTTTQNIFTWKSHGKGKRSTRVSGSNCARDRLIYSMYSMVGDKVGVECETAATAWMLNKLSMFHFTNVQ